MNTPRQMPDIMERREIERCTGIIDAKIRETNMSIDNIKLDNERKERDRKFEEERKRQERYKEIQLEAMNAARKNAELEMRWAEYRELEECQELSKRLSEHKEMFDSLVGGKKVLINKLEDGLRNKDSEYNKEIEVMKNEIDQIASNMRRQFKDLRDLCIQELGNIEQDLSNQRKEMIEEFQQKIEKDVKNHEETEGKYEIMRENDMEQNMKNLEDMRIENEKKYATVKIKAETEIQNCEKCFEEMKALYQLNTEKLNYNYKVLEKKIEENNNLLTELSKKESDFKNDYREKMSTYNDLDKAFKKQNRILTDKYRKISKQYKDLHKKFKHFKKADIERYNEIKEININEINKLKDKIIRCDVIIHTQQLGVVWEHPQKGENNQEPGDISRGEEENINGSINHQNEETVTFEVDDEMDRSEKEQDEGQYDVPEIEVHAILDVVLNETDFLLDDKIMSEIISAPTQKDKLLKKMNVLRKVLAITSPMELKKLIYQIYLQQKGNLIAINELNELDEEDESNEEEAANAPKRRAQFDEDIEEFDEDDLTSAIMRYNPDKVIKTLEQFIDEKQQNTGDLNEDQKKKKKIENEKKEKEVMKEKKYWDKMTKVLPHERVQMWNILDKISSKYYQLLLDRQKLINETTDLHNQNDELKNLLNQYLNVNHNLIVPPTGVINVNFLE